MAPKQRRAAAGGSGSRHDPVDDPKPLSGRANQFNIVFRGGNQEERYRTLENRAMFDCKFYHRETLATLGLLGDADNLLQRQHIQVFAHNQWDVHRPLVVEFLSSLVLDERSENGHLKGIHFRLNGEPQYLKIGQVSTIFGFDATGTQKTPRGFEAAVFFHEMTGHNFSGFRNCKASVIHNPTLYYLRLWLAHTIFARHESLGNMRKEECYILWSMTSPGVTNIDFASHMVRHWHRHATNPGSAIQFGAFITPIADAMGYQYTFPRDEGEISWIDLPTLVKDKRLRMVRELDEHSGRRREVYDLLFAFNTKTLRLPSQLCVIDFSTVEGRAAWTFPSLGLSFIPQPQPQQQEDEEMEDPHIVGESSTAAGPTRQRQRASRTVAQLGQLVDAHGVQIAALQASDARRDRRVARMVEMQYRMYEEMRRQNPNMPPPPPDSPEY